jgi:TolB-like protein
MVATLAVRRRNADDLPMRVESPAATIQLAAEPAFQIGLLRVSPSLRCVAPEGGEQTTVEPRVMQVLVALWRSAGEVVSRDRLIAICWDGRVVGDDAINGCVAKVRRIGETYGVFAVDAVPRVGYRLMPLDGGLAKPARAPWKQRIGVAATAGALALILAWVLMLVFRAPVSMAPRAPKFAVLPVQSLSRDTDMQGFAAGLAQAVAAGLNQGRLQVASSGEVERATLDKSGIDFTIGGIVERDGDRLHARMRLDDVGAGVLLWSADFSRPVTDARGLQAEISARVADVGSAAAATRASTRTPIDAATAATYIAGNDRYFPTDQRRMEDIAALFEQVARRAPTFAVGRAMYANMLLASTFTLAQEDFAAVRDRARAEAEAAVRLAPDEARVYTPLAALTPARAWSERDGILAKGMSLGESDAVLTLVYGRFLTTAGFIDDGVRVERQALGEPRPGPAPTWWLAWALYLEGDTDGALKWLDDLLALQPEHVNARGARFEIAALERPPSEVRRMLADPTRRPLGVSPEGVEVIESYLDARESGTAEDRTAAIERLLALGKRGPPTDIGILLLARLGAVDAAFELADRYVDSPLTMRASYYFVPTFLYAPVTEPMREDPRFVALLEKLDLPKYWRTIGRWPDFCAKEPRSVCTGLKASQ